MSRTPFRQGRRRRAARHSGQGPGAAGLDRVGEFDGRPAGGALRDSTR
ncbi:hypothetical protein AB0C21_39515 [Spirillospora sp. NPDC049024]